MSAYFDTSALVPLVLQESSSETCERAWTLADAIIASSLAYVEAHTALAHAERIGRLTGTQYSRAASSFDALWLQITTVTPSEGIIRSASALGAEHALRGYDAVHCATALSVASDRLFAVSGDRALLVAWHELGIATVDVNRPVGD